MKLPAHHSYDQRQRKSITNSLITHRTRALSWLVWVLARDMQFADAHVRVMSDDRREELARLARTLGLQAAQVGGVRSGGERFGCSCRGSCSGLSGSCGVELGGGLGGARAAGRRDDRWRCRRARCSDGAVQGVGWHCNLRCDGGCGSGRGRRGRSDNGFLDLGLGLRLVG